MVIAVFGLPGTGKTFFAKRLASAIDATYLGTDQQRKQMQHEGRYSTADKARVYEKLFKQVQDGLQRQETVVVDGTFSRHPVRRQLQRVAEGQQATLCWIQTTADEATIRQRVSRKREDSEADFAVYQQIKAAFDTPDFGYLLLDSGKSDLDQMLSAAKDYIFSDDGCNPATTTH